MFLTPIHLVKLEKGTKKRMLAAANLTDTTTAQFES